MASATSEIGTGTTITFGTCSWTSELLDVDWSGASRTAVPLPHMGDTVVETDAEFGNLKKLPGEVVDPGEITIQVNFNPDWTPPLHTAAEVITVTWNGGATWVCDGFMISFAPNTGGSPDQPMTATAVIALSEGVNITAAT